MPNHQMILSERQIAALADACNIDVRHIEKHADEEFSNQLDAFARCFCANSCRRCHQANYCFV